MQNHCSRDSAQENWRRSGLRFQLVVAKTNSKSKVLVVVDSKRDSEMNYSRRNLYWVEAAGMQS